jgi:dihydrodiol dehydrogenase / D-xylose 1-dehydrogenase (NADP)
MTSRIYNWGFVAAGGMARAMARDLSFVRNARVHSVFSRTRASMQQFSNEFSGCKIISFLEELLADPQVDIVYISSPNQLHYSQAKLALEAGEPVLCEKPFTLNAGQLAELIEIARSRNVFLMEAMWIRWLPIIVKLRQVLTDRVIGEPRLLKASFHAQLSSAPDGRIYNLAMGGGSLLDLGIYPISFASLVFGGQPEEIVSHAKIGSTGVDEHFGAVFHYPAGMALVSAGVDGSAIDDISIHGEAGSIRLERPWKLNQLTIEPKSGRSEKITLPMQGKGYAYQATEMLTCLDAGLLESSVMPLDESLQIMQTLDKLRSQWHLSFPDE